MNNAPRYGSCDSPLAKLWQLNNDHVIPALRYCTDLKHGVIVFNHHTIIYFLIIFRGSLNAIANEKLMKRGFIAWSNYKCSASDYDSYFSAAGTVHKFDEVSLSLCSCPIRLPTLHIIVVIGSGIYIDEIDSVIGSHWEVGIGGTKGAQSRVPHPYACNNT